MRGGEVKRLGIMRAEMLWDTNSSIESSESCRVWWLRRVLLESFGGKAILLFLKAKRTRGRRLVPCDIDFMA